MPKPTTDSFAKQLTANGQTIEMNVREFSTALLTVSGTYALTLVFEGSDTPAGSVWFPIMVARTNSNTMDSSWSTANGTQAWFISTKNFTRLRMRVSAFTSGAVDCRISGSTIEVEPAPINPGTTVSMTSTAIAALATVVGQTIFRDRAVTSTDVAIKAAANARLYSYYLINPDPTTGAWVHFYNALIANVTVGTTVPAYSVYVPPGSVPQKDSFIVPLSFATALSVAATTSSDHTVTTTPTTPIVVEVGYA